MRTVTSRRSVLLAATMSAAWMASPARAMMNSLGANTSSTIDDLIGQMSVVEKAGQLTLMSAAYDTKAAAFNPAQPQASFKRQLAEAKAGRLGGILNGSLEGRRMLQEMAVAHSRLKIPMLFGADVIHGYRTVFPVPLGEAASFDPSLAERTARVAAVEAAAHGLDWTYAPMVDVGRDARWGRTVEGSGEDVLINCDMAIARVKGFQGKSLKDDDAVLACAKHFAAYGAAESGVDYGAVDVSERTLREIYLPSFRAAFGAGALSTMAAFNEIAGIPASANPWLLNQVLRREWGFEGFVVSDWASDRELIGHGFAADERDAARLAIMAGVDMSMSSELYIRYLPDLVAKGDVPMARLDEAVRRVLSVKAALGLFENPYRRMDAERPKTRVFTPEHREVARDAGRRSIVMLKNDGNLLPLPRTGKRIAIIGPFAEGPHDLIGPWAPFGEDSEAVDLATGVRQAVGDSAIVSVAKGCEIETPLSGGIETALETANAADIVLLAVGESQMMSGEGHSRSRIVLPAVQQQLADAVASAGKPTVVLLRTGRALALEGSVLDAPAILVTWFLGTETGHAIADVLFGAVSPSGRLPVSFPRSPGQTPYHYDHKSTGRPPSGEEIEPFKANFIDVPTLARFPFGHGLTYGRIAYSDFAQSAAILWSGGKIEVSARIANSGAAAATEVVQLYVRKTAASVTQPVRKLKAYRRVEIQPGQSQRVSFTLTGADLAFLGRDLKPVIEPGEYIVWIGPSAEDPGLQGAFKLAV